MRRLRRAAVDLEAVGLVEGDSQDTYEYEKYPRMLALAERLTGVRITEDFLRRRVTVLAGIGE